MTFVLLGVASPPDLIQDRTRTPFNIGQGILLQDFSLDDVAPLQKGLEKKYPDQSQAIFTRIYHWTNGHPYLTQKLCKEVVKGEEEGWTNGQIDDLVERTFLSEKALKEENLQFVRDKILTHAKQRELLGLYRKVHKGQKVPDNPQSPLQTLLKLSGLVKTEHGHLQVRNEIYRHVFDLAWIKAHTAIDWVRWVAGVAFLLVVLLVGVLAQSTWAGMRDRDIRAEFHEPDTTSTRKIELLHDLFGLQAYLPPQDYDEQAKETFHSLPPAEQVALFTFYSGEDEPLFVVAAELCPTLADVQGNGGTQPVLEAMYHAIKNRGETKQEKALKEQLHDWLAGQEDYHDGKRQEALAHYNDAFQRIPDQRNPAILFERARLRARMGQPEEALQDLEEVLAIAEDEKAHLSDDTTPTATPSPTWTPEPSATPTIANTPTTSSPPTEIDEGGNEPPDEPIFPPEELKEPIAPLPTATPLPPNTAQFYSAERMRRAVNEFVLDDQGLINFLNNAPDSQYALLRSVITLPFPVVLEGTPIPQPIEPILATNAALVTELARWGKGLITDVVYSPDANQLAIATSIGIYLVDLQTLKYSPLMQTDSVASSVAFSSDGKLLASGSEDSTLRLWSTEGQLLNTLEGHSARVWSVAFSADGKLLASGSEDSTVRLWSNRRATIKYPRRTFRNSVERGFQRRWKATCLWLVG